VLQVVEQSASAVQPQKWKVKNTQRLLVLPVHAAASPHWQVPPEPLQVLELYELQSGPLLQPQPPEMHFWPDGTFPLAQLRQLLPQ
jgi:hypothetical protein